MDRKRILRSGAGFLWLVFIGSLLHFTFQWSNNSVVVGLFSPVNESIWEHLKMGYWALIFFIPLEYPMVRKKTLSYFFSRAAGVLVLESFIVLFFYTYTAFTGKPVLWVDISTYVMACFLCQVTVLKLENNPRTAKHEKTGIGILALLGLVFILFTFYPPHYGIFREMSTGSYGIQLPGN
jgi:hypothetical protein